MLTPEKIKLTPTPMILTNIPDKWYQLLNINIKIIPSVSLVLKLEVNLVKTSFRSC